MPTATGTWSARACRWKPIRLDCRVPVTSTPLLDYLATKPREELNHAMVVYLANLTETAKVVPALTCSIVQELADQRGNLKLIASENYCSLATQLAAA
jgi:hypothetical protein